MSGGSGQLSGHEPDSGPSDEGVGDFWESFTETVR